MNHIKTFEGFFSNIFGRKDKKTSKKRNFSPFSKEHDNLAEKILNSLKDVLSNSDKKSKIIDLKKYADYKRSVKFQSKEGKIYNIEIQKSTTHRRTTSKIFGSSSGGYTLVINNKHYKVSNNICKKIWDILDENYDNQYYDVDNIDKDFE
jgi:hypothetical protein